VTDVQLVRDQWAIDKIAVGLGTRTEWPGAETLEWIANVIGTVRPHPGDAAPRYRAEFEAATGRPAPADFIGDEGED
jgi:hypothetical protein